MKYFGVRTIDWDQTPWMRSTSVHWSLLGPGSEEKWYAALAHKPDCLWNKVAEETLIYICRERLCIQRNECFVQRTSEKTKVVGKHRYITTRNLRLQSCYHASLFRQSAHVYRAVADWCQDLSKQIKAHSPPSTVTPVANVDDDPASQVP